MPGFLMCTSVLGAMLFHKPAMTDHQRLTRQDITLGGRKKQHRIRHIIGGRKLTINGVFEHDVFDDLLLGNPWLLGLFRSLVVYQWRPHKAWADDISRYIMGGPLFGQHTGQTQ